MRSVYEKMYREISVIPSDGREINREKYEHSRSIQHQKTPYRSRARISLAVIGVPACTAVRGYGEAVNFVNFVLEVS